ncbi:MAG: FlgD immunoglobulin-like domain containing protein [Candidatus Eisenbacteria bacterium]
MKMHAIVVTMLVLLPATPAWPAPTVYFEPAVVNVEQGQGFSVGIRVDAGADTLTCFLAEFTFDASVIELLVAEEGTLFAESGHSTMFDWDQYSPGLHSCNDVTLGFDAFVMCPGELVHLGFHAVAEGATVLSITAVDLRDIRRDPILPVFTEGGSVTVGPGTGVPDDGDEVAAPNLRCRPNPFSDSVVIELDSGSAAGPVRMTIHDVTGRVVARPVAVSSESGCSLGLWDGTGHDGRPLPEGVYFVLASGPTGEARERVALVR